MNNINQKTKGFKIFRTIAYFFIGYITIWALAAVLFFYKKEYSQTIRSTKLKVINKENQIVGYLFGSMHPGFSKEELNPIKDFFSETIPTVTHIFVEAIAGHWSAMRDGVEKTLLQEAEHQKRSISVTSLESLESAQAMLGSLFYIGKNIYYIPYGSLFISHTRIANTINFLNQLFWLIPNILYQNIINPSFRSDLLNKNNTQLIELRSNYLNNKTALLENKQIDQYRIMIRDKNMYKKVKETLHTFSGKDKFLIVIGSGHLSVDNGIISHFVKDGYKVEPV